MLTYMYLNIGKKYDTMRSYYIEQIKGMAISTLIYQTT